MSTLTMVVFFGLLLVLGSSLASRLINSDELQVLFTKVLKNETADNDLKTIQDVFEIYRPASSSLNMQFEENSRMDVSCLICTSAFAALRDLVLAGQTDEMLSEAVIAICISLKIVSDRICQGIVPLNVPIITYIVKTTPEASPRTFCSLLLQNAGNPNTCPHNDPRFEWTIDLPEENPVENDQIIRSNNKPLKAVLVSDAHIDPLYEPNGVADCNELTCCRKGQTPRADVYKTYIPDSVFKNRIFEIKDDLLMDLTLADDIRNLSSVTRNFRNSPGAGYWGDYRRCDSPPWAYDDVIETIAKHKDIDVVYYLGDNIDHHVWETTYELIDGVNFYTIDKMKKEFGENVIVVPCIGNHESQPTNQYAPSTVKGAKLNTTWLYDSLARKWDFYLSEDAKATIKERGSFTTLIRPGLRAISVNNNYAYRYNWWLVYDPLESKRLMEWLVQELYKAEQAGEKVHILAHIPPGVHNLIYSWTREYNRVVNRFSKTIAGEFNGHTHSDEFRIFYNAAGEPSAVSWGAGSATAFSNYNSNYKIATIDPITYKPINIVNYVYNLTEANLTPNRRPHWFQLYDMKNTFQLQDLSATSMNNLVYSMVTDNLLLLDYYAAFYSKLSDARWPDCNNDCKIDNLCKTVVTVLWHREKCEELRNLFFTTLSNLK